MSQLSFRKAQAYIATCVKVLGLKFWNIRLSPLWNFMTMWLMTAQWHWMTPLLKQTVVFGFLTVYQSPVPTESVAWPNCDVSNVVGCCKRSGNGTKVSQNMNKVVIVRDNAGSCSMCLNWVACFPYSTPYTCYKGWINLLLNDGESTHRLELYAVHTGCNLNVWHDYKDEFDTPKQ
jgi:hypothetical protein